MAGLKGLRKGAGYATGRDLARELGVPASTYANYEKNPDRIPLRTAWAIADRLGTTIDAVVGREAPAPVEEADGLGDWSRAVLGEFASFLRHRESESERERMRAHAMSYERAFLKEAAGDPEMEDVVLFGSDGDRRAAFEAYLRRRADAARARELAASGIAVRDLAEDVEPEGGDAIGGIMAAYDALHGRGGAAR